MTVPHPTEAPFARELLIAQLAVQRAALATKRVFAIIHNHSHQTKSSPADGIAQSPITQYLHHHRQPTDSQSSLSCAKPDKSPVTIADLAAQALIIAAIHSAFPNDTILGEEDASQLRDDDNMAKLVWDLVDGARLEDEECEALLARPVSKEDMMQKIEIGSGTREVKMTGGKRVWTLDPVDGTSAFMSGGQYAISLALLEDGKEVVGVLGCPNWRFEEDLKVGQWRLQERDVDSEGLGLMLSAVKGQGATVRRIGRGALCEGLRVDRGRGKVVDLKNVHFVDSSGSPATYTEKVKELAKEIRAVYPAPTQAYSSHMRYAAMVLGGREFVQFRWPNNNKPWSIWDHAGSQLIYTESGAGKVTDMSGSPIDFTAGNKLERSWGLITADESIHGKILALAREMASKTPRKVTNNAQ
jgi:3'(2'), 5'-bisphosphate nucleotidase